MGLLQNVDSLFLVMKKDFFQQAMFVEFLFCSNAFTCILLINKFSKKDKKIKDPCINIGPL